MRNLWLAAGLVLSLTAAAQQNQPPLTAEQIIEKSIEASGGRARMARLTTTYASGMLEFTGPGMHGKMEVFAKAPNKQLIVTTLEGVGELRQAFDGQAGWVQLPSGDIQEVSGAALDDMRLGAVFGAALKWREIYPRAELIGEENVGDRKAYAIRLTPASGRPVRRYIDAQTFLLVREAGIRETPQGPLDITVDFSDQRDVDGIQMPFYIRQVMSSDEIVIKITTIKNDTPIDDALFARPAAKK
jgi:hypothetical protein